jgi:hypothetical protein
VSGASAAAVVRFLGLTEVANTLRGGEATFPLGILYPYSRDLQRVCACYDELCREHPVTAASLIGDGTPYASPGAPAPTLTSFLASIGTLQRRIAFAPGPAGAAVAGAYRRALVAVGSDSSFGRARATAP